MEFRKPGAYKKLEMGLTFKKYVDTYLRKSAK